MNKRADEVTNTDVVQVVVHGAFFPRLVEWVRHQGFVMQPQPWPDEEPDALPTFFIQPSEELWDRARRFGPAPAEFEG